MQASQRMRKTRAQYKASGNSDLEIISSFQDLKVDQERVATVQENENVTTKPDDMQIYNLQHKHRPNRCCMIAIDYGTTFSSVSYAIVTDHTTNLDQVTPGSVRGYPSADSTRYSEDEVPTVSMYANSGKIRYLWGYQIAELIRSNFGHRFSRTPQISLVKLLLSDEKHLAKYQEYAKDALTQSDIPLKQSIADFLRELWSNAIEDITSRVGKSLFAGLQKVLVLSVPPGWKPEAVRLMQGAAKQAGLPEPQIVAEQEAAALAVLTTTGLSNANFEIGDIFLVVDAGGGTVDLASYQLEQKRPFRVTEVADSTGEAYGSSLINSKFKDWFKEKLKSERRKYLRFSEDDFERLIQIATDAFESKKRQFNGASHLDFCFEVNGLKASRNGIFRDNMIVVPRDEVTSWFDQLICDNIIPMIRECIQSVHETKDQPVTSSLIKYIVAVGGFSTSRYFRRKLAAAFEDGSGDLTPRYPVEVLYSEDRHESAVSRGSILRSLEPNFLTQRRLRTSYGVKQDEVYVEGVHDPCLRVFDSHEQKYMVPDCISWIYKAGDKLAQNQKLNDSNLHWTINADYDFRSGSWSNDSEFFCELYMSDESDAPDHLTIEQMQRQKKHIERCHKLPADLSDIDPSSLEVHTAEDGSEYFRIEYTLKASITGVFAQWDLVIPDLVGAKTDSAQLNITAAFKPGEAA